jgi:hypothetical protein
MKILNTWQSNTVTKLYFHESDPIYQNEEFRVFKQNDRQYLYTYKNIAINQLCALNIGHVDNLASGTIPPEPYKLIYDRALEAIAKGSSLL